MPGPRPDVTDSDFLSLRHQARALGEDCQDKSLWIACTDRALDRPLNRIRTMCPTLTMRTAGSQVPGDDATRFRELSAINYAVERLQVRDIVVCGHSFCFMARDDELANQSDSFLAGERDLVRRVSVREAVNHRTRDHVIEQLRVLHRYPSVCRAVERGELRLHGLFYLVESGLFSRYDQESRQFLPLDI
jgi:carbonic anhydrase